MNDGTAIALTVGGLLLIGFILYQEQQTTTLALSHSFTPASANPFAALAPIVTAIGSFL
jgi:hypothetical protein